MTEKQPARYRNPWHRPFYPGDRVRVANASNTEYIVASCILEDCGGDELTWHTYVYEADENENPLYIGYDAKDLILLKRGNSNVR